MNCDGCILCQSQHVHESFYFFFLGKRATPSYDDVNRNISLKKNRLFYAKKAVNSFFKSFFLYFRLFLLRFFLFGCSKEDKEDKELDSNKLKSFAKNIMLFCKKVGWAKAPPSDAVPAFVTVLTLTHLTFLNTNSIKCILFFSSLINYKLSKSSILSTIICLFFTQNG